MSRQFTINGSYARQAGGARQRHFEDDANSSDKQLNPEASTKPPETEKYQRREAYTMVVPNEDKRQKLLQVQQREEENARQHKEKKGKTPIKMTPKRVGGQNVTPETVRTQQQQQTNMSPTLKALEMRQKREKWRQEKRDVEDREIKEKKAIARQQAEKNEKKASLQKEAVRRHWDDLYSNQQQDRQSQTTHIEGRHHSDSSHITHDDSLAELCTIYPECSPSSLREVLLAQGSIEGVRQLLG